MDFAIRYQLSRLEPDLMVRILAPDLAKRSRSDRIRSSAPILSSSMSSCSFVFILKVWIPEKEFYCLVEILVFDVIGFYLNS
jgi:hypothetical protein